MPENPATTDPSDESDATGRRQSITLRPTDLANLAEIRRETGLSTNEILRRSLATQSFILRSQREGSEIYLEAEGETPVKLKLLY